MCRKPPAKPTDIREGRFMNRIEFIRRGWLLTALWLVPAAVLAADSPPEDSSWSRLGDVRADTLYVSRENVIALALAQNEMLAASEAMTDAGSPEYRSCRNRLARPRVECSSSRVAM